MPITYVPPDVRTTRIQAQLTAAGIGQRVQLAIIGEAIGRQDLVVGYEITNAGNSDLITETHPILGVSQIRSEPVGGFIWTQGVDFVFTAPATIDWAALTVINPPFIMSGVLSDLSGALPDDDYFYVVTALRTTNETGPVVGETVRSNEMAVTADGDSFNQITLTWNPVLGAEGYKIYRSLTSGDFTDTLLTTVTGEFSNSFIDDGSLAPGVGTPPGANTAYKKPATGSIYYVDYLRNMQDFFSPVLYTRLTDIVADYGLGSDIAKAATLALGTSGRGNGAAFAWVVSVPDGTLGSFQTALDLLIDKSCDIIIPISPLFTVFNAALAHVSQASSNTYKRRRRVFWGPAAGTAVGDPTTSDTMRYHLAQIRAQADTNRVCYCAPWGWAFVQDQNGAFNEEELDGSFVAAAIAGLVAAQPDRATSATNKVIQGFSRMGQPGGRDLDNSFRDLLASEGALVITPESDVSSILLVRDSITASADSEEDRELSIVMVEDYIRLLLETRARQFVGQKLLDNVLKRIENMTRKVFGDALKEELITSYRPESIAATSPTGQPSKVEVYAVYKPVYTIREIEFRYTFDLPTA